MRGRTWTDGSNHDRVLGSRTGSISKRSHPFHGGNHARRLPSTDSGKTWTRISDPQNLEMRGITAVAVDPVNPDIMYAGTTHLPWKTTDGGKTWESIHNGMIDDSDVFSIHVDPQAPDRMFASACSGIYQSEQPGRPMAKLMGIPEYSQADSRDSPRSEQPATIYAGTTLGLFRSTDSGATWHQVNQQQVNSMTFDPDAGKHGLSA